MGCRGDVVGAHGRHHSLGRSARSTAATNHPFSFGRLQPSSLLACVGLCVVFSEKRLYVDAAVSPRALEGTAIGDRRLGDRGRGRPSAGIGRRGRHGAGHRQGPDRRRDAGGRGRDQQSRSAGSRGSTTTDAAGKLRLQQPAAESVSRLGRGARVPDASSATSTCAAACRSRSTSRLRWPVRPATVNVVGHAEDLLERDPTRPHRHRSEPDRQAAARVLVGTESDRSRSPRRASCRDSNGFFHPVGDHAQTQFSIDNQPVTDQQSRLYSNQISPDAVQSMEIITGVAPAEYGDKSSLVVHIVTKSGLDQPKPTGSVSVGTDRSRARRPS